MRVAFRLCLALGSLAAAFIGTALVLTVVDLYIFGHGGRALGVTPLVSSDAAGVYLSVADALALSAATIAGGAVWLLTAARTRKRR